MHEFKINNEQNFVSNESFYMSWQISFATKPNFTRQSNLLCDLYKTDLKTSKFLNSTFRSFLLINYFSRHNFAVAYIVWLTVNCCFWI